MTFLFPGSDHENPKPGRAGKAQLPPGPSVGSTDWGSGGGGNSGVAGSSQQLRDFSETL